MDAKKPLAEMDDPTFLEHRREIHEVAEHKPEIELSIDERLQLARVEAEFLKRAGMAWADAYP
jgi:hypothetical protein